MAALQTRLNRIAIDFPRIPFLRAIDGEYGSGTEASVKAFQQIFALPTTGETDEVTWYRISYIYTAVTGLRSFQARESAPCPMNFREESLSVGSRGLDVLRMQYYLRVIAEVDKAIPQTAIDGFLMSIPATPLRNSRDYYGLTTTGVIDKTTWDKIVNAYYYVIEQEGIIEPLSGHTAFGRLPQDPRSYSYKNCLTELRNSVTSIPSVNEDGIFGEETEKAVKAFQSYYGLDVDGHSGAGDLEQTGLRRVRATEAIHPLKADRLLAAGTARRAAGPAWRFRSLQALCQQKSGSAQIPTPPFSC